MLSPCGSCVQDLCEHGVGRSGSLSPGALSGDRGGGGGGGGDILGCGREAAQAKAGSAHSACSVEDVLQLLRILYIIGGEAAYNARTLQEGWRSHYDFPALGLTTTWWPRFSHVTATGSVKV